MEQQIDYLCKLVYKEILNESFVNKYKKTLNICGGIAFIMWIIAIFIFVFTSSLIHEHIIYVILMCVGGFFAFTGFVFPLFWISILNAKAKRYFKNIFIEKQNSIFNIVCNALPNTKIFFNSNNEIEIEKDGSKRKLILNNGFVPKIKFKLAKRTPYYITLCQSVSRQITQYVLDSIKKLWQK